MTSPQFQVAETSTPEIFRAAEGDQLVTRQKGFDQWRNAIMACSFGRHTPNRKVKITGWSITTCACGGRCFPAEGQGGPSV